MQVTMAVKKDADWSPSRLTLSSKPTNRRKKRFICATTFTKLRFDSL